MKPLPRSFYLRPTLQVARDLLGKYIVRKIGSKLLIGKIVEVEAYCKGDPASHAFRGRTKRNDVMFWEGGHLYVYFTYGMHFCSNVVTGNEGIGEAVLIRAVEPIAGIEVMTENRKKHLSSGVVEPLSEKKKKLRRDSIPDTLRNLTNGPAKFCQAFSIARKKNGLDLLDSEIIIIDAKTIPSSSIARTARIGIRSGLEKKWRFFVKRNPWVSK
ncbi:MAG: DNA-3-methyladenine glycosylase [Ignavibacteriales bacterium]|nr:DNA-3-methyladenine glycosylase [Ignavibacteriales bacterium]